MLSFDSKRKKVFIRDFVTYRDAVKTVYLYLLKKNNNIKKNHSEQNYTDRQSKLTFGFQVIFTIPVKKKKKSCSLCPDNWLFLLTSNS